LQRENEPKAHMSTAEKQIISSSSSQNKMNSELKKVTYNYLKIHSIYIIKLSRQQQQYSIGDFLSKA